jgi:crotonobetainyl-CoA:carnitine CoA-transferase CaiB-like acyl-CoA transferase
MSGVYDGLTVIEIADRRNQWAGKLLSDGGARVIQVEPTTGSAGRWSGPFVDDVPDPDRCLDYWWYNTGKQSLALDITRKPGQDLVRRLAAKADVFLESTKPGTLAQYGLDYAALAGNEALIYASLTDFGQDGPWRDYEMNDHAHLALGGQMGVSGYSDLAETPIGGHGHQAWKMGCVFTLHGITIALYDRLTSGLGQYIDVSIHDCCAIGSEGAIPEWLYYGETFYRQTGFHASNIRQPDLELPTGDGKYIIAMTAHYSDHSWANLVTWMEEKGVLGELGDPKYRDAKIRAADIRGGTTVRSGIRRLVGACTAEEAFHRAQSIGITWAAIRAPEENYDLPHFEQRDFWREIDQPEIGRSVTYPRGPFTSDQIRVEPRGRAPHLGEHTRLILQNDLGLQDSEIDALTAAGVVQ